MKKKQPYGDHRLRPVNLNEAFERFKNAALAEYKQREQELTAAKLKEQFKKRDLLNRR